jgi:methyl-accepting chemotaxis protein
MSTLDFAAAKLRHTSWKIKLRRFLEGEEALTLAQATDHHACDVGKWLYAAGTGGMATWGGIPEMVELEAVHTQMHAAVRRVIEAKAEGRAVDAEREFDLAEGLSQRMVSLLSTIERIVSRQAA